MRFWELIDIGLANPEDLEHRIAEMPEPELVDFYWTYVDAAADLKGEKFTQHLGPPLTEDYIDDVAQWIVGRGLDYYEEIMTDPPKISRDLPTEVHPPPWLGIASGVYRDRYGTFLRYPEDPPPAELS